VLAKAGNNIGFSTSRFSTIGWQQANTHVGPMTQRVIKQEAGYASAISTDRQE